MLIEDLSDIRRNALYIVVILDRRIKKLLRERHCLPFPHKLHDHVFRWADQVELVSQRQHIVQVFVGTESGILNFHFHAVILFVPLLEILKHGILTDDVSGFQFNGLFFVPVSQVDVFFPVADSQDHFGVAVTCGLRPDRYYAGCADSCCNRDGHCCCRGTDRTEHSGCRGRPEHTGGGIHAISVTLLHGSLLPAAEP